MSLQSFKEKIENLNGLYPLNLAIEEEREYYLESIGGVDTLQEKFPAIYGIYQDSLGLAERRMQGDASASDLKVNVHFDEYDIRVLEQTPNKNSSEPSEVYLGTSLSGSFLDKMSSVVDTTPPRSFTVWLNGNVRDANSPRLPYMKINNVYEQVNQLEEYPVSESSYSYDEINNRVLRFNFTITVCGETDGNNIMQPYVYKKDKAMGNTRINPVDEIHIDSPVSKHPNTKQIRILYGRTEKNLGDADYIYTSNKPENNDGKMWTIIPIKGYVKLAPIYSGKTYYSFKELKKPNEYEGLSRSVVQYNNTDWKVFRPDLNDNELYKLMMDSKNGIFKVNVGSNHVETLYFDLCNPKWPTSSDRRYDWQNDIDKASTDYCERIGYLIGGFEYIVSTKDLSGKEVAPEIDCMIEIRSTDKLPAGREYYVFKKGSETIYIPPVRLWWGCYAGDTDIMLADGKYKRADEIEIGDRLVCYGEKELVVDNIYYGEKEKEIIHVKTDKGTEIRVSVGHPMLMENGIGRAAEKLEVGDKIMMADGTAASVTSVTTEPYNDIVYNFTFEGEEEANYLIANQLYSGDFYAQNTAKEEPSVLSEKQKEINSELQALALFLSNRTKRQNLA